MEALTVGLLLKPRESTICWKERNGEMPRDLPVQPGELLLLCDDSTKEIIPGLHTVTVMHPEYGTVTCILDELVPVNYHETYYS